MRFNSTRELDPKKGSWSLNSPRKLAPSDLVISQDEWTHFTSGPGKKLKNYLPLALPEKITVFWLIKNLSVANWISGIAITVGIFSAGVYFSQTEAYEKVRTMFTLSVKAKGEIPNQSFQRTAFGGH